MIEERRVWQKLEELSAVFNNHIQAKRYPQAKYCYDTARTVSVFLELEEEESRHLFGSRNTRGEIREEGFFKEEYVQKAYFECCVKAKEAEAECLLCERLFEIKKEV